MERKWEPLTLLYQGISKSSEVVEDGGIICKEVTQACLWARCQILLQSTDLEDRQGEKKKKSTLGEGARLSLVSCKSTGPACFSLWF